MRYMTGSGRGGKTDMKNVIVAWYETGTGSLEEKIPLLWNGRRNKSLVSENPLTVVFLKGLSHLSPAYIEELKEVGYEVIDAESAYRKYSDQYASLDRFGTYEKKCFLRWLIIRDLYGSTPVIHYDGDIVWNIPVEKVSDMMKGKTFVLDGPAFTVISDNSWFEIYEKELQQFASDVDSYGTDWVGTEFRRSIGSDQDLIQYLIQNKKLPQDTFSSSKYLFIENPLEANEKEWGKMPFWHMQTDFIHYLNLRYMLEPFGLARYAPNPLKSSKIVINFTHALGKIAGRKYQSRRSIYNYFFRKGTA